MTSWIRHATGPFPVSPVPALADEVVHRYGPLADRYRITGRAYSWITQCGIRRRLIVTVYVELKELKRRSGGQQLGELVSTARNTYANAGSAAQFDLPGWHRVGEEEGIDTH